MRSGLMLAMMAAGVVMVVGAGACATTRAAVTPIEMAQQAGPIVREGGAEVTGARGVVRVAADEVVEVRAREGDLERPIRVTVRELVGGCVGGVEAPGCLAARVVDEPAVERRRLRFDRERTGTAIGFGLIGGAIGLCLAACGGDPDVGKGLALTGGIAVGAAALFLLAVAVAR